ncbi:MAG: hypothetical protein ACHQ4G_00765 [Opitutales bacterium]
MKFPRFRIFAALVLASASRAPAAPLERDLGDGLTYLRVENFPADLPAQPPGGAVVLDLRYAHATGDAAATLADWLNRHAATQTPVLILANAATAPDLRRPLAKHPAPLAVTLGLAGKDFHPDIAIHTTVAEERKAYAALPQAADVAKLLSVSPAKVRHDEAAMVKAINEGTPVPDDDDDAEPAPDDAKTPAVLPPLIDSTLQRAVQLHQAWIALHPSSAR